MDWGPGATVFYALSNSYIRRPGGNWPTPLAVAALFGAWARTGISEELDDKRM